jgi:hypothetical protein
MIIKNIHMHSAYLLREDFSISVTLVTECQAIDIIAIAVILLDAGSGESSSQKKGYSNGFQFHDLYVFEFVINIEGARPSGARPPLYLLMLF